MAKASSELIAVVALTCVQVLY